ncbi:hypothetical protein H5410_059058 [Solanum commersonii]|uniref:Glucose-1-phosphate adenylyltransferase n=1 Tax=Solanum commersonii TaxID=4109 RepID=A0A9J5W1T5_SOLCO|nr:hypothetical protein H5410_059058 [Solanum commersonii]
MDYEKFILAHKEVEADIIVATLSMDGKCVNTTILGLDDDIAKENKTLTNDDKKLLYAKGSDPIGIGKNCHTKRVIIDKNARIGDNVKIININNIQEAARESDGYFIKSEIVTVIEDAVIPSGTII